MVKAVRIHEFGEVDVLKIEDVEVGDPGPGQLRLRHTAIGFNFLDIAVRKGIYPVLPELPSVLGTEAAGVVEAVGECVEGFAEGDRVAYAATLPGAYAEGRLIDASQVEALPDDVSDEVAAASAGRSAKVNGVGTGRDAPDAIVAVADTVTEMRNVKHAYESGLRALKGVDY